MSGTRHRLGALVALVALACAGCARERVEVAQLDGGDVAPPTFTDLDGASDASPACGPAPTIGACAPCPNGYVLVGDAATCDCCPP